MAGKEKPTSSPTPEGERIAKVLSRRGIASRREAERLIEAGEVTVNGKTITSPALNVTDRDRITVSGEPLPAKEPARLWLYYKPEGLVTSASDEKGRDTVFDRLPEDMPRVMSVGRLDLNSEGLLLLTNDGELKRRLELPSTGWLRKYRVRVNGNPTDPDLEPLRKGITIEGERFQPMQVVLDRIQGANAWLTVGLREGKNREIRRAMSAIGLTVNRLIRVSYGPFRLNEMQPGQVEEVRPKILRDQLGEIGAAEVEPPIRSSRSASGGKTVTRAPRGGSSDRLPASEGLRQLSQSWQEATRPRSAEGAKPVRRSTTTSTTKAATEAPRDGAKPAARRSTTVSTAKPARDTEGAARKPVSRSAKPATDAPRDAAKPATRRSATYSTAKPSRDAVEAERKTSARSAKAAAQTPREGGKPATRRTAATAAAKPATTERGTPPRGAKPAPKATGRRGDPGKPPPRRGG